MYQESGIAVRVIQTPNRQFVGVVEEPAGREVFGPYGSFEETTAVMRDYMTREIRALEVQQRPALRVVE